jgi:Zn-dependent protease with chaperone function
MSDLVGWIQIAIIIAFAGVLAGAAVSTLATRFGLTSLRSIAPRVRVGLLAGLAMLPILLAATFLLIAFAPSLLDAAGLVQDHCAHHSHHAFHLCFVHDTPPQTSPLILGAFVVLALWMAPGWSQRLDELRASRGVDQSLRSVTTYDSDTDSWRVDSKRPFAMTLGLIQPRVYISERLRELLSERQVEAVLEHERAHATHMDALVKHVAALAAELQIPWVARALLAELDLACEQACDARAAAAVGDRFTVAEAILAVERASRDWESPAAALGFADDVIEARVKGLLEPSWTSPHWSIFAAIATATLCSAVVTYDNLHHAAETLLSYLF